MEPLTYTKTFNKYITALKLTQIVFELITFFIRHFGFGCAANVKGNLYQLVAVFEKEKKEKNTASFLASRRCSQFMCVKLPSVSKWGRIALTDAVAVYGTRLLPHRRYSALCKSKTIKEVKSVKRQKKQTLTDEENDSR